MLIFKEKCTHAEREEVTSVLSQMFSAMDNMSENWNPRHRETLKVWKSNFKAEKGNFLLVEHRIHYDDAKLMHFDIFSYDVMYHVYVKRHTVVCARARSQPGDPLETGPQEENSTTVFDHRVTKIEGGRVCELWAAPA